MKIVAVEVLMHKLDILWRSRNKLAKYSIIEIYIINATWFKFGMPMQNKNNEEAIRRTEMLINKRKHQKIMC